MDRKILAIGVALVLFGLAVGFSFGRRFGPERVEVQEKVRIQEVEKQVVVVQEKVRIERVEVAQAERRTHKQETITTRPDGTTTTVRTEDDASERKTSINETATADKDARAEVAKSTATETDKKTIITNRPSWKISATAGVPLADPLHPIYGGSIEHRVVGPLSAGVWAMSNLTGGISVSIEF